MKNKDSWGKPGVHSLFIFPHFLQVYFHTTFCKTWSVWFALGINGKLKSSEDLGGGKTRYTEVQQASQKLCDYGRDVKGYKDISKISIVSSGIHS